MEPTFQTLDAITLCGVARTFTGATRHQIPDLWMEAVPKIFALEGRQGDTTYGACIGMNTKEGDDYGFVYMAAVEVGPTAAEVEGMTTVVAPAGRYAVYTFDDHISKFSEFVDAVWRDLFPTSGLTRRSAPDFERYDERWDPETGMGPVDYFIPVE